MIRTIIIADDSATARMIIKRCFEIAGCAEATFLDAGDGAQALELAKNTQPDLVVTDLNMPKMDGRSLLIHLKASPLLNGLPVIVITSANNDAKEAELRNLGAFAVLSKPIAPPRSQNCWKQLERCEALKMEYDSQIHECLNVAVSRTMEDMAFEEVEKLEENSVQLPPEDPILWAAMQILQPIKGEISIKLTPDCGAALTRGLYGDIENNPNDETINDALAEIINTVAGCFMKELTPPSESFELGLPSVGKCIPSEIAAADFSMTYDLSGQLLIVSLSNLGNHNENKIDLHINGGPI